MTKNVQIDRNLFIDLYDYFCGNEYRGDEYLANDIRKQLEKKLDALIARELYTKYKKAPPGQEREKARQAYLNERGITGRSEIECRTEEPPDDWNG